MSCRTCNDTGEEHSGACHCGASMEGHSLYDNHMATEMTRPCPDCVLGADAISRESNGLSEEHFTDILDPESWNDTEGEPDYTLEDPEEFNDSLQEALRWPRP